MDYRHHWHDVLVGAILGLIVAYFSYRQYYPSLSSEMAHRPYAPRVKRESDLLPMHSRQPSAEPFSGPSHSQQYQDSAESMELADGAVPRKEPSLNAVWKQGDTN
jgi:diacylglycerol diphosphate phosphatase/phosphatidate phosphatase